jgi:hypothetical protein
MILRLNNSPLEVIIDEDDFGRCSQHTWTLIGGCKGPRIHTVINKTVISIGRFLLRYKGDLTIDHIDRNFLNCRKNNLRLATNSQNNANKNKISLSTSSKYKGVTWDKAIKKWRAQIMVNKKQNHLGSYSSEKAAAKAYNKAALKYFKEFARLNNI